MSLSKFSIMVLAMALLPWAVLAQGFILSGTVKDRATGRSIPFANVIVLPGGGGTSASETGSFEISVENLHQADRLVASYVGYKPDTLALRPGQDRYEAWLTPTEANLSEVVITGVSRATLVRESPIPIVPVSAHQIQQTSGTNIIDQLVRNVPGLNAVKTGPNISKPFIRGLGYNRVLTLYDGIRQEGQQWGDEHGIEVDAYNIERAEVVKGPASLVYGSDALAGVVGLVPAVPADHAGNLQGQFISEYQSNNGLVGNGLRLMQGGKRWSYALRGSYRIAKDYSTPVDGRVYNTGFRETNASAVANYKRPMGNTSFNLTLYDNRQGIPDGSRDSLTRRFTYQAQEGLTDNVKARPIVPESALESYRLSPLIQHIQHYRAYTKTDRRLGQGRLDALLAFQQNIRREFTHPTQPEQAGMYLRLNTVNYGVNYHAPTFLNTDVSFGVNGMYQANKCLDATDFPIPEYRLFDAGIYGTAKWKYRAWSVTGGLRYDRRQLAGRDFYTRQNPLTGFDERVSGEEAKGAYLQFPAFNLGFGKLSMSFGGTYALSNRISLKANLARGYRAPSITELASNGLDPGAHIVYQGDRSFRPEFSLQQDVGVEFSSQAISGGLSLFHNNVDHYIYLTQLLDATGNPIADAQGNRTYRYQQAGARLYGVEASLALHPVLLKGFAIENAFSVAYGQNREARFRGKGVDGEYLPFIPPMRLMSTVKQTLLLGNGVFEELTFRVEAEANAAQNRYLGLNNTETATPGYTLFHAGAGLKLRYRRSQSLQVFMQVNNAFDRAYQSNLSRLKYFEYYSASPNGRMGIYGMGRNVCLKLVVPL